MKSQDIYALHKAKKNKNDEFYTSLCDIENEMKNYKEFFKGKIVLCNCDDSKDSKFIEHFSKLFIHYGLKKLIGTHYVEEGSSYKIEYFLDENNNVIEKITPLKGNGDFSSDECVKILQESDVIVTNPPFSLFRKFIKLLEDNNKKYIIMGNVNAISYKEIFSLMKDNKLWLGKSIHSGDREFRVPDDYGLNAAGCRVDAFGTKYIRVSGIRWFTNVDYKERHESLELYKKYNANEYPKYDNYNAINVDVTKEIPMDYDGVMGVPITFLDKYCPEQFNIVALGNLNGFPPNKQYNNPISHINGVEKRNDMINSVLTLKGEDKKGNYYTADNINYHIYAPYARILIQKNKDFNDEFEW